MTKEERQKLSMAIHSAAHELHEIANKLDAETKEDTSIEFDQDAWKKLSVDVPAGERITRILEWYVAPAIAETIVPGNSVTLNGKKIGIVTQLIPHPGNTMMTLVIAQLLDYAWGIDGQGNLCPTL